MKIIKVNLVASSMGIKGSPSTLSHPTHKMEFHGTHLLVNDTVIVPIHRVVDITIEAEPKPPIAKAAK